MGTCFWYSCHLVIWWYLPLQGIFPSATPWPALAWSQRQSCWNIYWVHQHTYLHTMLYVLFLRYFISGHQSLWLPERASFSSTGLHSSWWQSPRENINHQGIFSADLPPWYLQSYFHPCHALCVKKSHKYCPLNVWWKHHTSYLAFDDAPSHNLTNFILTKIPSLHSKVQNSENWPQRCSPSWLFQTSLTQQKLTRSLHQKSDLKMWIIFRHGHIWMLTDWMSAHNPSIRACRSFPRYIKELPLETGHISHLIFHHFWRRSNTPGSVNLYFLNYPVDN